MFINISGYSKATRVVLLLGQINLIAAAWAKECMAYLDSSNSQYFFLLLLYNLSSLGLHQERYSLLSKSQTNTYAQINFGYFKAKYSSFLI